VKQLSALVQATAAELSLAPEVLATRRDLEQLAEGGRDAAVLRGWRGAALGARLLSVL
jgi:ribonuclease D